MKKCSSPMAHMDCKHADLRFVSECKFWCDAPYRSFLQCTYADLGGLDKVNMHRMIEHMRYQLQNPNTPYKEMEEIRLELHRLALENYEHDNTALAYLKFLNDNACKFEIASVQDRNCPYYMRLFTVAAQYVYGDCAEECLDAAIRKIKKANVE